MPAVITSYWIFAWFLIYYFGFTKYNPKIWLIIALIENIIILFFMTKSGKINLKIFTVFIVTIIIKVIPIYLVRNTEYKLTDFIVGIVMFFVYICWVFIRLGYNKAEQYIRNIILNTDFNKPMTPMIYQLQKMNVI